MTTATSKRQQARNEKALQELIKTVPGNDRCADCQAKNPGWASYSLGIFLCMRCASLHRKLGTHISKVKSLSMDSWSNEQVENMKRTGNVSSNKTFTPNNSKPNLPLDVDEVDSAMERFIRQKYEHRLFQGGHIGRSIRHNTGSTSSDEQPPPPLPPKPGQRFGPGFRAASSTFPLQSSSRAPPRSPDPVEPPSRSDPGLESKLSRLREMGFTDESRNVTVLKALDGNLDKSVETLIRFQATKDSRQSSRSQTPSNPYNPFLQRPPPLEQAFDNMDLGAQTQQPQLHQQQQQSLFPHATGGFPQPPHIPVQQTFTPPLPSSTWQTYFPGPQPPQVQQYYPQASPQSTNPYGQFNPFFQTAQPSQPQPSPQPIAPQQTGRDKASILALYNAPHLVPPLPQQQQQQQAPDPMTPVPPQQQAPTMPPQQQGPYPMPPPQQTPDPMPPQRSVSSPILTADGVASGSRNPFLSQQQRQSQPGVAPPGQRPATSRHLSQESMDVTYGQARGGAGVPAGGGSGPGVGPGVGPGAGTGVGPGSWAQSGRHSPDAFANLSARYG